ncbi:Citrate lyase beta subunit [Roseovarius pacificus]|uniref:Citrate lyase beta subunit n=1 Tax=Roseovarius pacificus TaxID=337701 RepID=A0A1M7KGT2_9RHOB|nr:aldolase/citrate lyase family protein [Roseovarius pacificus]SHM64559.1 Citrate lyase beta subunit [Roseovarius pacificus]
MTDPFNYLFVPGHRPERFAKAVASGAHRVILDLEDAVGAESKDMARDHVAAWFDEGGQSIVRINAEGTPWWRDDIALQARQQKAEVMVPKAEPDALARIAAALPGRALIAIVETAEGLSRLRATVRLPEVARIACGNIDFGADTRIPGTGPVLDPARFEIVLASRLSDLPAPIDGVTVSLDDAEEIAADVARAPDGLRRQALHPPSAGSFRQCGFRSHRGRNRVGAPRGCSARRGGGRRGRSAGQDGGPLDAVARAPDPGVARDLTGRRAEWHRN